MSVAFRRESDEEHLEPKFELPIPAGPNLVTAAGPALLAERAAAIEAQLATTEGEAREPLLRELRYWRTRVATAVIAPAPEPDEAGIGSTVTFRLNGATRTITIVGHDEADAEARIAYAAPLARALMGAAAGDLLPFQGRDDAIEILDVERR